MCGKSVLAAQYFCKPKTIAKESIRTIPDIQQVLNKWWFRDGCEAGNDLVAETPRNRMLSICPCIPSSHPATGRGKDLLCALVEGQNSTTGPSGRHRQEWQCPHGLFISSGKC